METAPCPTEEVIQLPEAAKMEKRALAGVTVVYEKCTASPSGWRYVSPVSGLPALVEPQGVVMLENASWPG